MTMLPFLSFRIQPSCTLSTRLWHFGLVTTCLISSLSTLPASRAATEEEICRVDAKPADTLWQCNPPKASGVKTIFWAPERCGVDMEAVTPNSISNLRFVLFNTRPDVVLSVIGSSRPDVLVGSPNTSDDLQGLAGSNTFVVGGQSSYLLGRSDVAFLYSTTGESDWVGLSSTRAEFIYISSTLQGDPGSISLASITTGPQPVRGSNEIAGTLATCITPKLLWTDSHNAIPDTSRSLLPSKNDQIPAYPRQKRARKGFPGTPTLQGFDIQPTSRKRIILPANDYLFNKRSLAGKKSIDVLVAPGGIRLAPTRVISQKKLGLLIAEADGLSKLSRTSPLIYFPKEGLLVFSSNQSPLGSRHNPGRILARLLDRDGSPLKAPVGPGQVFPAKFVRFMAPAKETPR